MNWAAHNKEGFGLVHWFWINALVKEGFGLVHWCWINALVKEGFGGTLVPP